MYVCMYVQLLAHIFIYVFCFVFLSAYAIPLFLKFGAVHKIPPLGTSGTCTGKCNLDILGLGD